MGAVRLTVSGTGFEQHGFLNILLAVDAALRGEHPEILAAILGERLANGLTERQLA